MPTKRCAWGTCNSDSRYKEKDYMTGVEFYRFPRPVLEDEFNASTLQCKEWIKACGRPYSQLNVHKISNDYKKKTRYFYICSKHFLDNRPTTINPSPVQAQVSSYTVKKMKRKAPTPRSDIGSKKMKICVESAEEINTINDNISEPIVSTSQDTTIGINVTPPRSVHSSAAQTTDGTFGSIEYHQRQVDQNIQTDIKTPVKKKLKHHILREKYVRGKSVSCPKCTHNFVPTIKDMKLLQGQRFVDIIMESDASCFRYTGFPNRDTLKKFFDWIHPFVCDRVLLRYSKYGQRQRSCAPQNKRDLMKEFIITMVRIRQGYDVRHLSFLFGISKSHVSRIFLTWVKLLSPIFNQLLKWPSKEHVSENLPDSFKQFPRTRVIIDATEFHVEKPFRPRAQRLTWSNYKQTNTFKLLVGIMPTGTITFISKLYSGGISDLQIVHKSKLLDLLEENDNVMADRGFNIRHLLLEKKCDLNIPAFSHGRQLGKKASQKSRAIASVRIHVERAIRRMKTFKILSGIIPLKLRFTLDDIITIVSVMCNLQGRLA